MKKILVFITFIIFLLVASLLSVPYWLDVNEYKEQIAGVIKDKTGYDVKINGRISARALPDVSLVIDEIAVSSLIEGDDDIFSSEKLILKVKLASVLNILKKKFEKIEIDSLKIVKPVFNLRANKAGNYNWESPTASKIPSAKDEVTEVSYIDKKTTSINETLFLNEFEIKDGSFFYIDEKKGHKISVSSVNINTTFKPGDNKFLFSGKLNVFEEEKKGNFDISGTYLLSDFLYKVKNLDIKFDKIRAHSNVEVDLSKGKPLATISFYSSEINLNDYIANDNDADNIKDDKVAVVAPVNQGWSSEEIDFSSLNKVDSNFNFKASGIKYKDFELGETAINTYLKNGRLTINLKDIKLYGGVLNGESVVDAAAGLPAVKSTFDIKSIDLQKIVKAFKNKDFAEGFLNAKGSLYSVGSSQRDLINKLSGKTSIDITEGYISGLDLFSMQKSLPSAFNVGRLESKTRFEKISGDLDIKDGIVINENFVLKSDIINFEGRGEINLPLQTIAYRLEPKYSQDFEKVDEVKPRTPILISGNMFKPVFRLEVKTILQDIIKNPESGKNLVNQLKRDFKDIKKNIIKDDTVKGLKGLFQ